MTRSYRSLVHHTGRVRSRGFIPPVLARTYSGAPVGDHQPFVAPLHVYGISDSRFSPCRSRYCELQYKIPKKNLNFPLKMQK